MFLVAPTERTLHGVLSKTEEAWKISSLPERHGCDVLIPTRKGIVGFQRKTLPDLVSSLHDGRLYYELSQIISSATITYAFLTVESSFYQTADGNYTEANISVGSLHSVIAKFSVNGVGFLPTSSPSGTVSSCLSVSRYLSSGNAHRIHRPKQVTNEWGQTSSRAYGIFLLQSFPGIGPKVAESIYDYFGTVPIGWTVTAAELARIPGIGRRRAESLVAALAPVVRSPAAAGPS